MFTRTCVRAFRRRVFICVVRSDEAVRRLNCKVILRCFVILFAQSVSAAFIWPD